MYLALSRFQSLFLIDALLSNFLLPFAIASSSLITELVKGQHIDKANKIQNTQIAKQLALPPVKIHCSVLAEDAIKSAVNDYKAKSCCKD